MNSLLMTAGKRIKRNLRPTQWFAWLGKVLLTLVVVMVFLSLMVAAMRPSKTAS